jgi:hypothetical protein
MHPDLLRAFQQYQENHGWRHRLGELNVTDKQTRGVSQYGLAIYIKKYSKAKEELWKLKYFTMQRYNLQKNPLKETLILHDIIITL